MSAVEPASNSAEVSANEHWELAAARMPGDIYTVQLTRLQRLLQPRIYLEIGVADGHSLVLAEPPTVAVGVDPVPSLQRPVRAQTRLYPQTSDDFFAHSAATAIGRGKVDLAFIDGLHHFEQALRDFANVERHGHRGAVVVMHDTIPLDELTQRREILTSFWTGDVWKFVVLLAERRPLLTIFTIPTFPSGLTVITNLDPHARLDRWAPPETIESYMALDYSDGRVRRGALNYVTNDWPQIARSLLASNVVVTRRTSRVDPWRARARRALFKVVVRLPHALRRNPLFDARWYLERYPDVVAKRAHAYRHYWRQGIGEGRDPNELFDTRWYLAHNPDVLAKGLDPLDHYFLYGAREGRNPSPRFDTNWYLDHYPDVRARGMDPLEHWLRHGRSEGRAPGATMPQTTDEG